MEKASLLAHIHGGLIVSCQALPEEPLHGASIMARMAIAAQRGGAAGIRTGGGAEIQAIREAVDLPILGLRKRVYPDSDIYITPTFIEVDEVAEAGADVLAMDATGRHRPGGLSISEMVAYARQTYPSLLLMADVSTIEEGLEAASLGFDMVGTTLAGYTSYTRDKSLPDFALIRRLASLLSIPLIAEVGIWTPEQLAEAMQTGAYAAVVGTAITRPMDITRRFVQAIR